MDDKEQWSIGLQPATELLAVCAAGAELRAIASVDFATDFPKIESLLDTLDGWLVDRDTYESEAAAVKIQAVMRGKAERKEVAQKVASQNGRPGSPGSGNVFELEENGGRSGKRGASKERKSTSVRKSGAGAGACMARLDRLYDVPKMPIYFGAFVIFQGLMYCIWLVLATGMVMPANRKSELACMAYFFIGLYQAKVLLKYKRMMKEMVFSVDQDHDFYHRCYSQLNFHTQMVVFPMVAMLIITLIFTFSFMETLNYNNVRRPEGTSFNMPAPFATLRGCKDERAINYNPLAEEDLHELCTFARCYEDVYVTDEMTTTMTVFACVFFGLYVGCFISAYFVSRCHLRFVEQLYYQRHKAKILLKEVWRKVIRSSSASERMNNVFGVGSATKLRVAHVIQFVFQGVLCVALMVGKMAVGNKRWFLEFDIMIILWGYEAGRHFPRSNYIQSAGGMADIYAIGTRLSWHHSSMYYYFALTAVVAYLSVSGAYRMMPPDGTDAGGNNFLAEICESTISDTDRTLAVTASAASFLLLTFSAGWLTMSHYFNYQSVKRDHATILAFADAFKNMLERRRRRAELAFDRNAQSPRAEDDNVFAVDWLKKDGSRKRGQLRWESPDLVFVLGEYRNNIFIETGTQSWPLSSVVRFEARSKSPPELVTVLKPGSDDEQAVFASKDARSIASRFTRMLADQRSGRTVFGNGNSQGGGNGNGDGDGGATFESEDRASFHANGGSNGNNTAGAPMSAEQQQMMMQMMQMQQQMMMGGGGSGGSQGVAPVVDDT
eukprot:SAG22_NODE_67_length_22882_cov_25.671553_11_plen_779_part_00